MKVFFLSIILIFLGILEVMPQNQVFTSLEVEELPVIKECEEEVNTNCFQKSLKAYIQENLNIMKLVKYSSAKAYAQFVVTESGEIENIRVRTTQEELKKEAIKLLNALKIKSPATRAGIPVSMIYTLPISFNSINLDNVNFNPSKAMMNQERPHLDFDDAAELPFYTDCESSNLDSCFEDLTTQRILNFLKSSQTLKNELDTITELKVYFEIQSDGEFSGALVVCESNKIIKALPDFINNMRATGAAKDEDGNFIPTFFLKNIAL